MQAISASPRKQVFSAVRNILFVALGILSAAFGIEAFLIPNSFIDGGVTGISMLLAQVLDIPLALLIVIINTPFIVIGFRHIGKLFAIKGAIAILGLSLALTFIHYPIATDDRLLAALFGGFFLGAGIGLAIRGGSVLDGTEIMALILSKKISITIGEVILVFNVIIFSTGALVMNIENMMYSILTYMAASKTVDFLIHGIEEYTGVIIVSSKSEQIRNALLRDLGRGVTIYKGKRGYTDQEQDILFCVITRLEIMRVKAVIRNLDPGAFIIMYSINDTSGGVIKRRAGH